MKTLIIILLLLLCPCLCAQDAEFRGQVSAMLSVNEKNPWPPAFGLRYIPETRISGRIGNSVFWDAEAALDISGAAMPGKDNASESRLEAKMYRALTRLYSSQWELRLGLQKINFGSASMLRPLMWFDRMDPRDPLQIAEGVKGLLFRYYFLNNANIWLWTLLGNDKVKGWEMLPSASDMPEYGARVQIPLLTGECALTYHQRTVSLRQDLIFAPIQPPAGENMWINPPVFSLPGQFRENRFGFDGKWDMGIGIWTEGSLIHRGLAMLPDPWQTLWTFGMDYTFSIGSGLYIAAEQLFAGMGVKPFAPDETRRISAVSVNYPLGIFDQITGIIFYEHSSKDRYHFLRWQRTFDKWSLNAMVFINPDQSVLYQNTFESGFFSGKGVQVMFVYTH